VNAIKTSRCCAIATDSQLEAEALDQVLTGMGKRWFGWTLKPLANLGPSSESTLRLAETQSARSFHLHPISRERGGYSNCQPLEHLLPIFWAVLTNAQQQMIGRIRDELPLFCLLSHYEFQQIKYLVLLC